MLKRCPECGGPIPCSRSHRDACLVPAEPFAELVRDYVERWNRDRPQPGGQFQEAGAGPPPIQAISSLAAEASAVSSVIVARGTIEALLERGPRSRAVLELRVADAIATALGHPFIFGQDPRVVVYRNPLALHEGAGCLDATSMDDRPAPLPPKKLLRLACCTGSSRQVAAAA